MVSSQSSSFNSILGTGLRLAIISEGGIPGSGVAANPCLCWSFAQTLSSIFGVGGVPSRLTDRVAIQRPNPGLMMRIFVSTILAGLVAGVFASDIETVSPFFAGL